MKKFFLGFIVAACMFALCSYKLQGSGENYIPEIHVYNIQGKKFVVVTRCHSVAICPY